MAALYELGWASHFAESLAGLGDPSLVPGRVVVDYGTEVLVQAAEGTARARLSSDLRQSDRPVAVGDWVGMRPAAAGAERRPPLAPRSVGSWSVAPPPAGRGRTSWRPGTGSLPTWTSSSSRAPSTA